MKRLAFVIILVGLWQISNAQRHIVGQKGLEISTGILDNFNVLKDNTVNKAFFFQAAYSWYNQKEDYWKLAFNYNEKRYQSGLVSQSYYPVKQYTSDFMYFKKVVTDRGRNFYLNLGVGPTAGYETVNNGKYTLSNGAEIRDKNNFIYGAALGADSEVFLTDKIIFLLGFRERYTLNSDVQKLHFQFGAGIKFIIY